MKKVMIMMVMILMISTVSATSANAGFFDWMWGLFSNEDTKTNNAENQNLQDIEKNITLSINNESFEENQVKSFVNSNQEYRGFISDIGYNCFQVKIGQQENFSVIFDLNESKIDDLSRNYQCSDEISIEKTLVTQIQEEGFNRSKLKEYQSQVDLPLGVYMALAKKYMN